MDSSTTTRNSDVDSPLSSRLPFFQRLFCCGRRALSSKQYGGSYKGEDFGVASVGEKEGVRNKLQSCRYGNGHSLMSLSMFMSMSVYPSYNPFVWHTNSLSFSFLHSFPFFLDYLYLLSIPIFCIRKVAVWNEPSSRTLCPSHLIQTD